MSVIGIPRGMLFYEFYPMWRAYFEGLGVTVVTSQRSSRNVVDAGILCAVDEACLPVKVFLGHCLDVSRRSDMLFVPRIVSVEPGAYTCPKILGLPDMVNAIPGVAPVLTVVVDYTKRRFAALGAALEIGDKLGVSRLRAAYAYAEAVAGHRRFAKGLAKGGGWFAAACEGSGAPVHGRPRVLVLGHSYVINDEAINLGMKDHLERLGAQAVAPESISCDLAGRCAARLPKRLFWTYEKRLYGSASHYMARGLCDGIIQVMSFGCGPDSLISEIIRREAARKRVPYMAMIVDEHTGEAGTVTRLEAYLDMLCRRAVARGSAPAEGGAPVEARAAVDGARAGATTI